ncbi:MAG TPA: TIGR02996 domain-containing protein [Kofleriaceae bacterium]
MTQLLADALASDDDAERLVYADWLEQQGDIARGQLIHLQCELARVGRFDRRTFELETEIEAILDEHGERFRSELPDLSAVLWTDFARGFVATARVHDLETLDIQAAAIAGAPAQISRIELAYDNQHLVDRELPWLHELVVSDEDAGAELAQLLAKSPWARKLTALEIPSRFVDDDSGYADDPTLGAAGAKALTALAGLERLTIDRQRVGTKGFAQIVRALANLRELRARECLIQKLDGLAHVTGAPVVHLDLGRNAIGNTGAKILAHAPRLAELQSLELDTCEVGSSGLAELVSAPWWRTLRRLDLSRNPIGASGLRALAEGPRPSQLHALIAADADLDDQAGHLLAKIPWLGQLAILDLSGNRLARGAASLRSIAPEALRRLALSATGLERTEAAALARFWPHLIELDLGINVLTDAGLERFVTMKEATALQRLELRDCAIGDDGIELLARRARCPRLRRLGLADNTVRPAALEMLLGSPLGQRLESLDLAASLDDEAALVLTRTTLPPRLRHLDLRRNELAEATLLTIADAPGLVAIRNVLLDGDPWGFAPASRDRLAARFGPEWYRS